MSSRHKSFIIFGLTSVFACPCVRVQIQTFTFLILFLFDFIFILPIQFSKMCASDFGFQNKKQQKNGYQFKPLIWLLSFLFIVAHFFFFVTVFWFRILFYVLPKHVFVFFFFFLCVKLTVIYVKITFSRFFSSLIWAFPFFVWNF